MERADAIADVFKLGARRTPGLVGPMLAAIGAALQGPLPSDGFEYTYRVLNADGTVRDELSRPRARLRFTPIALRAARPDCAVEELRRPIGSAEEWTLVA